MIIIKHKTNKNNMWSILIMLLLVYCFITIMTQLIERPWNHILWSILLTFFLLIIKFSTKFVTANRYWIGLALLVSFCLFYFMVGAASIGYGSEYISYKSGKTEIGTIIIYDFEYWNKVKITTSNTEIIPIGGRGLELITYSVKRTYKNNFLVNMKFLVEEENVMLPSRIIIIRKIMGIVPVISIKQNNMQIRNIPID